MGARIVTADRTDAGAPMKRVAAACFAGSAIEFYDFYIYGTAAALVFPTVFFPNLGSAMATIASMGTFAAAFLSPSPNCSPLGTATPVPDWRSTSPASSAVPCHR
jgi:hypothetical protein